MDIPRQPASPPLRRRWWWLVAPLVAIAAALFLVEQKRAPLAVDREKLLLATVEKGPLTVRVRGQGVLAPRQVRWVSSEVDGKADRVLVKPGAAVLPGDLLVELSNPLLRQHADEKRWELEALIAHNRSAAADDQALLLDRRATVLRARLGYEASLMKLKAEEQLIESGGGAVSQLDYQRTRLETTQLKENWQIEQERSTVAQTTVDARTAARAASEKQMTRALARLEAQVEALEVRAPVAGVVQEVALEAGQRASMGGNIARLAGQEDLIAEIQIPERLVRDTQLGQAALVDTRHAQIEGHVSRIAPSVVDGHVQVDVELVGPLPDDARPDLAVQGEVRVAEFAQTLFVRRPALAQTRQQMTVYRLTAGGDAQRVPVTFGRASVQNIQVLEGLGPGDRIIISDTSQFERYARIQING